MSFMVRTASFTCELVQTRAIANRLLSHWKSASNFFIPEEIIATAYRVLTC